ncbi:hypothetical protein GBAR_LOCUS25750 [Geodia barretti]|uniref:Uncharacterized protein n=1 Tax=Geodia barretti TaxID=519541 RepID=A0AA35TEJ8_GEOBA|nr:hypothetical protein GBAR_LOCUS25750 [Geodia barretti]
MEVTVGRERRQVLLGAHLCPLHNGGEPQLDKPSPAKTLGTVRVPGKSQTLRPTHLTQVVAEFRCQSH